MKLTKTIRRALTGVMALSMVFAFSAGAFAYDGYYVVGDPVEYNNPIDVKVVIESREDPATNNEISEVLNVQLGQTNVPDQTFTVQDAMYKISSTPAYGITMYGISGTTPYVMTSTTNYIYSMAQGGVTYAPSLPFADPSYSIDGWMFRLNGQIPLLSLTGSAPNGTGPTGAAINNTPIADGDVIHFYWDYPYQETQTTYYSANFVYPAVSYNNGTMTVQLQDSYNWFANDNTWTITPFANLAQNNIGVTIYDAAGNVVANGTGSTGSTGSVAIQNLNLTSGATYYVKVNTTDFKGVAGYDENWDDVTYQILDYTMGYAKFTV